MKFLSGMTFANEPWTIMPSFKKVVALSFATGSYMLIFHTLWEMSALYDLFRFMALMILAIGGMVTWIIIAHGLWEKARKNSSFRLRMMYNTVTVTTLSSAIIIFYMSLFVLFLLSVTVFVPSSVFEDAIDHAVGVTDYLKLAWLATSIATVAGAIGAGLENEEAIRKITYGYRQYTRSKELKEKREAEEKREKGRYAERDD